MADVDPDAITVFPLWSYISIFCLCGCVAIAIHIFRSLKVHHRNRSVIMATAATSPTIYSSGISLPTGADGRICLASSGKWISASVSGHGSLDGKGVLSLSKTGVTSGTFQHPVLSIDEFGRVTNIASAPPDPITFDLHADVAHVNKSAGNVFVSDGNKFSCISLSGDVGSVGADGKVSLAEGCVVNSKLGPMPRGSIKIGGADGKASDLKVGGSGGFLTSDGTDARWSRIDGDVASGDDGKVRIADGAVTNSKLGGYSRGMVKAGGIDGKVVDVLPGGAGHVLMFNGQDVCFQPLTGDVSIDGKGKAVVERSIHQVSTAGVVGASDRGTTYINPTPADASAAAVACKRVLPDPVGGLKYSFVVTEEGGQEVSVADPAVHIIRTVYGAGTRLTSAQVGSVVELMCLKGREWYVINMIGSWGITAVPVAPVESTPSSPALPVSPVISSPPTPAAVTPVITPASS